MGEWERKELKEGRCLDPTWPAGKDAAFSGLGYLPSAHRGKGGGRPLGWLVREKQKQGQTKGENE